MCTFALLNTMYTKPSALKPQTNGTHTCPSQCMKRKISQCCGIKQYTHTKKLQQRGQIQAQRIRRYEKREIQHIQNKMFKEDTNKFYRNLGTKNIDTRKLPSTAEVQNLLEVTVGRKSTV